MADVNNSTLPTAMDPRRLELELDEDPREPLETTKPKKRKVSNESSGTMGSFSRKHDEPPKKKRCNDAVKNVAQDVQILATDFGMTYSSICSADQGADPSSVSLTTLYPGCLEVRHKVRSILAYPNDNKHIEHFGTSVKWGFQVNSKMSVHALMKSFITKDAPPSVFDDPILISDVGQSLLLHNKEEIRERDIIEFLRMLYEKQLNDLKANLTSSYYDRLKLVHVLTYPANYTDTQKDRYIKLAKSAGFGKRSNFDQLQMVSEPEAAALALSVWAQKQYGPNYFNPNSYLMILDMGGLTVDAIVYLITSTKPEIKFSEACVGQAGLCGVVTLQARLVEYCIETYGEAFTNVPLSKRGPGSKFMDAFEQAHCLFDGETLGGKIRLPIPMGRLDHDEYDDEDQEIIIRGSKLKEMMDSYLKKTLSIVDHLLTSVEQEYGKHVEILGLAGGGSLSPYVLQKIQDFCHMVTGDKTTVIRPDSALSLVVRGACMSAMSAMKKTIISKKCRRSYGVLVHRRARRDEQDKVDTAKSDTKDMTITRMEWHFTKGMDLQDKTVRDVRAKITLQEGEDVDRLRGWIDYYTYDEDGDPPTRPDAPGVQLGGHIHVDFSLMSKGMKKKLRDLHAMAKGDKVVQIKIRQKFSSVDELVHFYAMAEDGTKVIGELPLRFATEAEVAAHRSAQDEGSDIKDSDQVPRLEE